MKTAIHFANGFEEIEALTVVDVLRRAEIPVNMVSVTGDLQVEGSHGINIFCDSLIEEVDYSELDMLILPGGMPGAKHLQEHALLQSIIQNFNNSKKQLAAICAAPMILGEAGILKGKKATCFPGFEKYLKEADFIPETVLTDGTVTTAAGAGLAMDFALRLVEIISGKETADQLAQKMLFKK